MKTVYCVEVFGAGFLPALRIPQPVEQYPTDSGKILCRKHTNGNASLSGT
jgi:hypothetical protein